MPVSNKIHKILINIGGIKIGRLGPTIKMMMRNSLKFENLKLTYILSSNVITNCGTRGRNVHPAVAILNTIFFHTSVSRPCFILSELD